MSSSKVISNIESEAKVKISLNHGPVSEVVTITLLLENVEGFQAGMPVQVNFPEEEVRYYIKKIAYDEIVIGGSKEIEYEEPRKFFLSIFPTNKASNSYILDKKTSLSINIPYCVIQKIRLRIRINDIDFEIPTLIDKRSIVQVDLNDVDHIFKVNSRK